MEMVCGVRVGYVDGQVLREILDIIEHCVRYSLIVLYIFYVAKYVKAWVIKIPRFYVNLTVIFGKGTYQINT